MDFLYEFWFTPDDFDLFALSHGYIVSAMVLLLSTTAIAMIYYLWLGKSTDSFSTTGAWFIFGLINSLLILILCISILGFRLKENTLLAEIDIEIWIFSFVNAVIYGFVFYLIISLIVNNYSTYSKYIPFNLFK